MQITFFGAAEGVTGSKHLIEHDGKRILLECGMHQGHWLEAYKKNKELPFDATSIDAVILSHAHIDHSGMLPVLVKHGYTGPIYTTVGTDELLNPLFMDAAHIQKEDALYYGRLKAEGVDVFVAEPLFDEDDVRTTLQLLKPIEREKTFRVADIADVTFYNAGHIMGSSQIQLVIGDKTIAFTGDLGSRNRKILHDPVRVPYADIMLTESTYGGRLHKNQELTRDELAKVIHDTHARGGKIIIPSFALERTQEILYDLHRLYNLKKVPRLPVFVDSPLATDFTKIFNAHRNDFDEETHEFFIDKGQSPFAFKSLTHTTSTRESKKLNAYTKPCIIIAGSGMCEAGRIKHHLKHHIDDAKNTVLIVGYQATHTLGRKIIEGESPVKILGKMIDVKANIVKIGGYSAHGDQKELVANVAETPGVKNIIIVHGDPEQQKTLRDVLHDTNPDWEISIPAVNDTISF